MTDTLGKIVYDRVTGHAGTAALIGTRCTRSQLPQVTACPCVVYHAPVSASDEIYRDHDGATRVVDRVQLDCWGKDGDEAESVATQIVAAFNGWTGHVDVGYSLFVNRVEFGFDPAVRAFRHVVDVLIDHKRAA